MKIVGYIYDITDKTHWMWKVHIIISFFSESVDPPITTEADFIILYGEGARKIYPRDGDPRK